jgi:hypothetical protein
MKILFVVALMLVLLVLFPLATIWSLNTLFPALAIPVTLETLMATVILGGVVGGTNGVSFGGKK